MRNLFLFAFILLSGMAFAQKTVQTEEFIALESKLGADIEILPATSKPAYSFEVSNIDAADMIEYRLEDKTLKLRAADPSFDFDKVTIRIYVPELKVVAMSNGGTLRMSDEFSPADSFVVSVTDNSKVDVSNIDFKSLVVNSKNGGDLKYKSAKTLVSRSGDDGKIIIAN